jgi:hypothetical protein
MGVSFLHGIHNGRIIQNGRIIFAWHSKQAYHCCIIFACQSKLAYNFGLTFKMGVSLTFFAWHSKWAYHFCLAFKMGVSLLPGIQNECKNFDWRCWPIDCLQKTDK